MPPYQGGGSMISTVNSEGSTWNAVPWKFEAGTPDIAGVVSFGPALGYFKNVGWQALAEYEETLKAGVLQRLKTVKGLRLFGPEGVKGRIAVFSFNIEGIDAQDIGAMMDSYGIAMRVGNHCAQPLMACYKVGGMARASFYIYNTLEEADRLVEGLKKAQKLLAPSPA
jgi:cysteine desulfurase/selenocysteine lyase